MSKSLTLIVIVSLGLTTALAVKAVPSGNPPTGGGAISVEANSPANSFYIKSNGNVGIGTTAPDQKLTVNGNIQSLTDGGGLYDKNNVIRFRMYDAGSTDILSPGAATIRLFTNGAVAQTINSSGLVGIGTTTPAYKLTVAGDIYATGNITCGGTCGGGVGSVNASGVSAGVFGSVAGKGNYTFQAAVDTDTVLFVDATNKRVGIGVASPEAKLDILGSVANDDDIGLRVTAGNSGERAVFDIVHPSLSTRLSVNSTYFALGTISTPDQMILKAGNVGIGTTTPGALLDIAQTADSVAALRVYNSHATHPYGLLVDNTVLTTGETYYIADFRSGGTSRLRVNSSGNVGIGTTTPAYKLDVQNNTSGWQELIVARMTAWPLGRVALGHRSGEGEIGVFGSDNVQQVRISAGVNSYLNATVGNVGIGTTAPGSYKLNVSGDVYISGKLTVSTIDPIYTIGETKYATYVPSMTGQKEETAGVISLACSGERLGCSYEIDFSKAEKGSDLWLFYQVTDFGSNWDKLTALLTPGFDGKVWYEKKPSEKKLVLYATPSTLNANPSTLEVSYRLTAPRFDWQKWGNVSNDTSAGFVINEK